MTDWGRWSPTIERWAGILGRPCPSPVETVGGRQRLSAVFVEWMMGLPEGYVTGVPGLTRGQQLRALGNGVVPAQGAAALRHLAGVRELWHMDADSVLRPRTGCAIL